MEAFNVKLSLRQMVEIELLGYVYLEDRYHEGWKKSMPYYAFKCPIHGYVESYAHGYVERLECPICRALDRSRKLCYPSKEHEGL